MTIHQSSSGGEAGALCQNDVCLVGGKRRVEISQHVRNALHLGLVALLLLISWLGARSGLVPASLADALALLTIFLGYPIYFKAARSLLQRKIGVPLLVTIAEIASLAIGAYFAAGTVVLIILAGTYLEDYILDKARGAIKSLVELSPRTARVLKDEQEMEVDTRQVLVGDLVLVKPGERIPVDGTVVVGFSAVDQAAITGESMPVDKGTGDAVFAGTLNQSGALKIRTTRVAADTTLARMIYLVEQAQEKRAPIQNVADRFTTFFLPGVLVLSGAIFALSGSLVRAVTVLLVACPCAMALAVPIAVVGAIGNAGRKGVLVKGGTFVERLQHVDTVVFDKTGTLTYGVPQVTDVVCLNGSTPGDVLQAAATAEKLSEHPLARAILARADQAGVPPADPDEFTAVAGKGVIAQSQGHTILVGTSRLMEENQVAIAGEAEATMREQEDRGATVLLVAQDQALLGLVAVADVVKEGLAEEIAALKTIGIKRIALLSGDNHAVSQAVGGALGITEVVAGLLPEDKAAYVERLREEGHRVVMVGDGVNDAPALAAADVGMAMGTAGTDVAIEAADVSLLGDDIAKVGYTIELSRKAFQKMKMNIAFAIVWNALGLTLASLGYLTPTLGAILQEAGCISVVINSSLLLFYRPKGRLHARQ